MMKVWLYLQALIGTVQDKHAQHAYTIVRRDAR
jgi:hypothetical protein